MCRLWKTEDDGRIVVDEIAGQLITLAPLLFFGRTRSLAWVVTGFVVFRCLDVWKPGPVRWLDQNVHGGAGVVLDDVLAGVFGAVAMAILMWATIEGDRVKAEVLTIGDELLRGEITDSNKSFLSQRLLTLDIETRFHVTCADDRADMAELFRRAAARSDVVLVSGGLGPTRDDLTIEVLAETFGRKLVLHEPSLEALRGFFARFGREMAAINEKQAWFPEGAEVLDNPIGTAPGHDARAQSPRRAARAAASRALLLHARRAARAVQDDGRAGAAADRVAAARHELGARVAAAHLRHRRVEPRRDAARPAAARRRRARLPHPVPGQPRPSRSRARRAPKRRTRSSRARARCCANGSARSSTAKARRRSNSSPAGC